MGAPHGSPLEQGASKAEDTAVGGDQPVAAGGRIGVADIPTDPARSAAVPPIEPWNAGCRPRTLNTPPSAATSQ